MVARSQSGQRAAIQPARRRLLTGAAALALAGLVPKRAFSQSQVTFKSTPFTLGVASGYALADRVVLWTRLAPRPDEPGGGVPSAAVPVQWELATDEQMRSVIQRGTFYATPDWAHAVHVEPQDLAADRWYWYRFAAGGFTSPVGRTRTTPAVRAAPGRLRFALASCQHYEQGFFVAYRKMLDDALDLVVHVGDYIYESSWGRNHVRKHGAPEPFTLEDYRVRHALYKGDEDLQAAHQAYPWLFIWDDHEVENDYAGAVSENDDPPELFLARRAAAYKAYYEHMPLPRRATPFGAYARLYTRVFWGRLATFFLLDDRQYRTQQACPRPGRAGSNVVEECPERFDPRRTILGEAQERWLYAGLASTTARWNFVTQQTLMAQFDLRVGERRAFHTDGWDGYPPARERLLGRIAESRTPNPVVIGGDVHAFYVADLKRNFDDPEAAVVASEFVGTSITSQARPQEQTLALLAENPHVKFGNSEVRGYTRFEVRPGELRVDLRALETVARRESDIRTLASFVVEDGKPGAVRA
jgi:alkaline phosphatase D